jgi:hypothetical protein
MCAGTIRARTTMRRSFIIAYNLLVFSGENWFFMRKKANEASII